MLTPFDIENKEFSRGVRGYKEEEVDEFLDEIVLEFERLMGENEALKAQLSDAAARIDEYKNTEGSVLQTLEAAKGLMNDISASAEKRAGILIKNAELDAEILQRQARENVEKLKSEEEDLIRRVASFKDTFRKLLENELARLNASVPGGTPEQKGR